MTFVLCPECGTARTGSFRYCRSCSYDFDASIATAMGASTPVGGVLASADDGNPPSVEPGETSSLLPDDEPAWMSVTAPGPAPAAPTDPDPIAEPSTDPHGRASSEVVVVKKRTLRQAAGLLGGALVGAMLTGAVVIPFLGEALVQVGAAAGVAVIVVSALIGMRIAQRSDKG